MADFQQNKEMNPIYVRQLLYNSPKVNLNPLQYPNFSGDRQAASPPAETPGAFKSTGTRFNQKLTMRKSLYKPRTSMYDGRPSIYGDVPDHLLQARGLDVTFENERNGGIALSEPIVGVDFVLDRLLGQERQTDRQEREDR
jgi:hypothetical protein